MKSVLVSTKLSNLNNGVFSYGYVDIGTGQDGSGGVYSINLIGLIYIAQLLHPHKHIYTQSDAPVCCISLFLIICLSASIWLLDRGRGSLGPGVGPGGPLK